MAITPKPDRYKKKFFNHSLAANSIMNVIIETLEYRMDENASLLRVEIKPDVFGNKNVCSFEVPIDYIQLANKK